MLVALTRVVSPSIVRCELSHRTREPIDVARAMMQHERYESALQALGCAVERLPPEPELPDAVFVEDTAVVLPDCAIIARPGAVSRRPETDSVASRLVRDRTLLYIEAPGTLDGGDVFRIGRRIFMGISGRTNTEAAQQVERLVAPLGYTVERIVVQGCLHLKSAATPLDGDELLLNPRLVDPATFGTINCTTVPPEEPFAANVLCVGRSVLCGANAPRTHERLAAKGYEVTSVDASELAKAEGGLTCCCLIFEDHSNRDSGFGSRDSSS